MLKNKNLLAVLLPLLMLAGCGNKGPLYQQEQTPPQNQTVEEIKLAENKANN